MPKRPPFLISKSRPFAPEDTDTDELLKEVLDEEQDEDDIFDRKHCPNCNARILRRVDPRQDGFKPIPGVWVNYRCSDGCGFARDYVEELEL